MPLANPRLLVVALLSTVCSLNSVPVLAASSTASLASDSASTSVGSASDSIRKSSKSSSRDKDVAEGNYRVIEVAELADQPGMVRVALQPVADGAAVAADEATVQLLLPVAAAQRGQLAAGQVVSARHRPYGIEFAQAQTRQPFFLVLDDAWHRELASNPV